MLLLQFLVLCLLASNLAELKTDSEQLHVSFDQSKERSGYTTHIFKESIPRLSSRTDLLRRERARHDYVHQVVFLIRQRNMDELIRVLHDVSDPLSTNYGQHWSGDEVANLTSNPESCEVLVSYLHAAGASVVSKTLYGDYITAAAPISVWETMFNTVFYAFHHTRRINDVRRLVSAEQYSIPVELDPHVEGALYVIDIPVETITSQSRFITEESITQDGVYSKQFLASGFITPSQLRAYYNISSSVSGSSVSTQGIFASTGSYYSPSDLLSFENTIGITQQLPISVGNHSSDSKCTADPNNCSESNLDLQYIIATSPGSPTTHWYTDNDFNSFLTSVSSLASPSLVYSISYGAPESSYASNQLSAFSILAIKLGVRGVTLVASSGDDGAVSYQVANQKNTSYCGYEPQFPASNPYITSVGATSVSLLNFW